MYWNIRMSSRLKVRLRLTLTWDVLKSDAETNAKERKIRLTLTWDVLKLAFAWLIICGFIWLTLTWDVLKYKSIIPAWWTILININMRCIEMLFQPQ